MTFPRPVLKTLVTLAALVALLAPFAVAWPRAGSRST